MKTSAFIFSAFLTVFSGFALDLENHNKGTCSPGDEVCAYFSPSDMPVEAVRAYLKSAKKSIRIATYNLSIKDYAEVLNAKANAGVKIEYMVDYKNSYSNKVWPLLKNSKNLEKIRLPVFRGGNPQMHNKIIIIDNEVVITGSANYSSFGLIANFENVMAIKEKKTIEKFDDEVSELKAFALKSCELFSTGSCQDGGYSWDSRVHDLLSKGGFPYDAVTDSSQCRGLIRRYSSEEKATVEESEILSLMDSGKSSGIFDAQNQLISYRLKCVSDKALRSKFAKLGEFSENNERFVDGQKVSEFTGKFKSTQSGKIRSYFSPEDNIEQVFLDTLDETLKNPSKSIAYFSTNFITNGKFARKIVQLHEAGVEVQILFDLGRFKDEKFRYQIPTLSALGFFNPEEEKVYSVLENYNLTQKYTPSDFRSKVTVFANTISSDWGCNHNKFAVIGTEEGLTLINGSANWSGSAMRNNGENAVVVRDNLVASIYLKEIVSQMYIYRFQQKFENSEFQSEILRLSSYEPCLKTLLGLNGSCQTDSGTWSPRAFSNNIISLHEAKVDVNYDNIWAYVPQLNNNNGGFTRLYTHDGFAGKWVGTISLPVNWRASFKFFKYPKGQIPSLDKIDADQWEYGGVNNDRWVELAPAAVSVIKAQYYWGKP